MKLFSRIILLAAAVFFLFSCSDSGTFKYYCEEDVDNGPDIYSVVTIDEISASVEGIGPGSDNTEGLRLKK